MAPAAPVMAVLPRAVAAGAAVAAEAGVPLAATLPVEAEALPNTPRVGPALVHALAPKFP